MPFVLVLILKKCQLSLAFYNIWPGSEVKSLEYSVKLKIKRNDWLLADTYPQAANHCSSFLVWERTNFTIMWVQHESCFINVGSKKNSLICLHNDWWGFQCSGQMWAEQNLPAWCHDLMLWIVFVGFRKWVCTCHTVSSSSLSYREREKLSIYRWWNGLV